MVRDSRTPGTYTVSVFTKAIVRYGAKVSKAERDSPEVDEKGGMLSNVREYKK